MGNGSIAPRPIFHCPISMATFARSPSFAARSNFWGSFCAPCREEMPSMERLIRQYEGQGMVMVAVTFDPKKQDADEFMEAFLPGERSSMTVLWDPTSQTGRDYGTELVPETYIIDRKGRVIARFVNAYDWSRPEVKQLIESLLRSDSNTPKLL